MKTMTVDAWNAEGVALFGRPARKWMFLCPSCGTVQSGQDFINAGMKVDEIQKYLAFSCIGRFAAGKGCDWTLGGLFQIHQLELLDEDGKAHPRFEFATPEVIELWRRENPKTFAKIGGMTS